MLKQILYIKVIPKLDFIPFYLFQSSSIKSFIKSIRNKERYPSLGV